MVRGRRRQVGPVFLDRSGRRRRLLTIAGVVVGAVLVAALGLVAVGALAGGPGGLPGWPDSGARAGADTADNPATPTEPGPSQAPPVTRRPPPPTPGATGASPTATGRPGQGDEHRRTPRPTKPR